MDDEIEGLKTCTNIHCIGYGHGHNTYIARQFTKREKNFMHCHGLLSAHHNRKCKVPNKKFLNKIEPVGSTKC